MPRPLAGPPGVVVLVLATLVLACGGRPTLQEPAPTAPSSVDRMTARTGEQVVTVDSTVEVGRSVERMMTVAGGYIERSSANKDGDVRIQGRVPALQLDSFMDRIAALGDERRRYLTGSDVTDQYADLEARLRSKVALRDRRQQLLARATTLDEVLGLEKQIARLQSEIDALQARLDRLRSEAALASLAVTLEHERVLGPLAWAGRGLFRLVSKLFVIR